MPQFTTNADRIDPYKNFKFVVVWDGNPVAGVSRVGALSRNTQVVTHREGGDPHSPRKSPGQTDYGAVTLERGVTHDTTFESWAKKVWYYANSDAMGAEVSLKDFRKNITIELYNEAGQKVIAYNVYRCWVSDYQAMPELDGNGNAVAIQSMTLQNEGWERDISIAEPDEAQFEPAVS